MTTGSYDNNWIYLDPSYPPHVRGLARQLVPGFTLPPTPTDTPQGDIADPKNCGYSYNTSREFDWAFFLLWPPNLFAFTSLFFKSTGAHAMFAEFGIDEIDDGSTPHEEKISSIARLWHTNMISAAKQTYENILLTLCPKNNTHRPGGPDLQDRASQVKNLNSAFSNNSFRPYGQISNFRGHIYGFLFGDESVAGVEYLATKHAKIVPWEILENWKLIHQNTIPARETCAREIWLSENQHDILDAVLLLHAIADRVCEGWGVRVTASPDFANGSTDASTWMHRFATKLLSHTGNLSLIANDRARVLPKRHTPSVGISPRAASLNLAFVQSPVHVWWKTQNPSILTTLERHQECADPERREQAREDRERKTSERSDELSVLILPWPLTIRTQDFQASRRLDGNRRRLRPEKPSYEAQTGFFRYSPQATHDENFECVLKRALENATHEVGDDRVDMVVLPEAALCFDQLTILEKVLVAHGIPTYISGVRNTLREFNNPRHTTAGLNEVYLGIRKPQSQHTGAGGQPIDGSGADADSATFYRAHYRKHHRWCLDRNQIKRYKLGGTLYPGIPQWEDIHVGERVATFVNLGDELTVCPVICEDLARQDELSDIIRAIGPSLLVAVLMDGPQRKDRWAAKYANIFGDDPGIAVLSVTSKGMLERARAHGDSLGPVALWTQRGGHSEEIPIDEDADAVLLNLAVESSKQYSLDGRRASFLTYSLTLAGVHQVKCGCAPQPHSGGA